MKVFHVLYIASIITCLGIFIPKAYPYIDLLDQPFKFAAWPCLIFSFCIPIELTYRASKLRDLESLVASVLSVLIVIFAGIYMFSLPEELSQPNSDIIQSFFIRRISVPFMSLMFIWILSRAIDKVKTKK